MELFCLANGVHGSGRDLGIKTPMFLGLSAKIMKDSCCLYLL